MQFAETFTEQGFCPSFSENSYSLCKHIIFAHNIMVIYGHYTSIVHWSSAYRVIDYRIL